MKFLNKTLTFFSALTFCVAAAAQQGIDNPHAQALAAVRAGNLAKVKDLIERGGANLNSRNRIGDSLLAMAIKSRKQDIANYLLDKGADAALANTSKGTPLMAAAFNGDIALVDRLLAVGVDVHAADEQKKTAMVYAAGQGQSEVVARLLRAGVDANARYANDLTALMWAAGQGHAKTVTTLLENGADPSLKDNRGKTALDIAADTGHLDVRKALGGR